MDNIIKAIPTEWNDIEFRSKSEALFAYHLNNTDAKLKFFYEPFFLKIDNWVPDFLIFNFDNNLNLLWFLICEYKPSEPTNSYLKKLSERFCKLIIKEKIFTSIISLSIDYSISYGLVVMPFYDLFKYKNEKFSYWQEFDPETKEFGNKRFLRLNFNYIEQLKSYRFDLK